jgi:outer membrane lipoprotein-sorting protein
MTSRDLPAMILALLLLPILASAQKNFTGIKDPSGFKRKFNEAAVNISTIESSFTQEKNISLLSDKVVSKGKFFFKKEKQLRWEYTDPFPYLVIFSNDRIYIRDESKETWFDSRENKMFGEINAIIVGSVRGTLFSDEKRFASIFSESASQYLVKLKPLAPQLKEYLSEIRIFFDKTDMTVSGLEMEELSGDYTKITFTGKKLNTDIPDEKFAFQ